MAHPNGRPQPPKKVKCPKCGAEFDTIGDLQDHISSSHK
jgi:uncharacterized C2H2 Zn-finger protein